MYLSFNIQVIVVISESYNCLSKEASCLSEMLVYIFKYSLVHTGSAGLSELIEYKIAYAEAPAALSKMRNNKTPGPDAFSVEFY